MLPPILSLDTNLSYLFSWLFALASAFAVLSPQWPETKVRWPVALCSVGGLRVPQSPRSFHPAHLQSLLQILDQHFSAFGVYVKSPGSLSKCRAPCSRSGVPPSTLSSCTFAVLNSPRVCLLDCAYTKSNMGLLADSTHHPTLSMFLPNSTLGNNVLGKRRRTLVLRGCWSWWVMDNVMDLSLGTGCLSLWKLWECPLYRCGN